MIPGNEEKAGKGKIEGLTGEIAMQSLGKRAKKRLAEEKKKEEEERK